MAGGNFDVQNKTRAGVYIRFRSGETPVKAGTRGTVACCRTMKWGAEGTVMEVTADAAVMELTGYDLTNAENRFLQEVFKGTNRSAGASKVLLYRLPATGAAKATVTVGNLTATAKYKGTRGNDLSVVVTLNTDSTYTVETLLSGEVVNKQIVSNVTGLVNNTWVDFSGSGSPTATTGAALTGGADGVVSSSEYATFLTNIEPKKFDVLVYDGSDATTAAAFVNFIKRIANDNGTYAQLVAAGLTSPDSRFVINVGSGVTLADGTTLAAGMVCYWVAGITAGANYNESMTAAKYPDAVAVSPVKTNAEIVTAINSGIFLLTGDAGAVRVELDINSLTTFTTEIGKVYHKNRVIRVCQQIANDLYDNFTNNFLGVIDNNAEGRGRLKTSVVGYLMEMQANNGIQNFTADDVEVTAGADPDAVVINIALGAVDSAEKFYITVEVA